jgi:hypothetical protein
MGVGRREEEAASSNNAKTISQKPTYQHKDVANA